MALEARRAPAAGRSGARGRRSGHAQGELLQQLGLLRGGLRASGQGGLDAGFQRVQPPQQHPHQFGSDGALAVAHPVQGILEHVREPSHAAVVERRRVALDGVDHTKDGGQGLGVVRVGFQSHEGLLRGRQALGAFGLEHANDLGQVEFHA